MTAAGAAYAGGKAEAGKGQLIISLTAYTTNIEHAVRICRIGTKQVITLEPKGIFAAWLDPKDDFATPTGYGSVVVKNVDAGDYQVCGVLGHVNGRYYASYLTVTEPFTLHEGEAVYLGQFDAELRNDITGFEDNPTQVRYLVSDEQARDVEAAQKRGDKLFAVSNMVALLDHSLSPYVRRRAPGPPAASGEDAAPR